MWSIIRLCNPMRILKLWNSWRLIRLENVSTRTESPLRLGQLQVCLLPIREICFLRAWVCIREEDWKSVAISEVISSGFCPDLTTRVKSFSVLSFGMSDIFALWFSHCYVYVCTFQEPLTSLLSPLSMFHCFILTAFPAWWRSAFVDWFRMKYEGPESRSARR